MSFDPASILASLMISGIGFVLFKYGRGKQRIPHIVAGVSMMVYPYFVDNVSLMGGIFGILCVLLWGATYLGM